jgi:hypothetical protein
MGHLKIVVDHEKIEYSGPLKLNELFRAITHFFYEEGYDFTQNKDFEQNTTKGKFLEWQIAPWKKITDYVQYIVKVRILAYDILKTDVVHKGKKKKIDSGRIIIVIDGYLNYDYDSYWDDKPMLHFIRTVWDYFVQKAYTERFEARLVHDVNHLYQNIEKLLNMNRRNFIMSRES